MAEHDRTTDKTLGRNLHEQGDLALLERAESAVTADDELEDGDTATEDSGAGSFLDRFVPSRPRRE